MPINFVRKTCSYGGQILLLLMLFKLITFFIYLYIRSFNNVVSNSQNIALN
jgi:hypothetical protein